MSATSFRGFELVTREACGTIVKANVVDDRPSLTNLARVAAGSSLLFLANPDNPTGTLHSRAELIDLVKVLPSTVRIIVDEAYVEYAAPDGGETLLTDVELHPNLLVVRSFSKAYGLAGMRLGWLYANRDWPGLDLLQRIPHHLSGVAIAGGLAALADQAFVERCVEQNRRERDDLCQGLRALGLHSLSSTANFVAVDAREIPNAAERLAASGVEVRDLAIYGKPGWLRVSVGTSTENIIFLERLSNVMAAQRA